MKFNILKITILALFVSLHIGINDRLPEILFIFYAGVFLFVGISVLQTNSIKLRLNTAFYIVSILFVILIIRYLLYGNSFGLYHLYTSALLWLLFFPFSALLQQNRHYAKHIAWGIVFTGMIEVSWGLAQSLGFIGNSDPSFFIGGSLGNSGAYAGYMSVISPLVLSFLLAYKKNKKYENTYYILLAVFIFSLYLLLVTKSRGAWIAGAAGCFTVLIYRKAPFLSTLLKSQKITLVVASSMTVLIISGSFFLYKFKENSAFGRLLVWKVTTRTPHANLLTGNGTGYVETQYGKWQAAYFEETGGTEKERYVADYVTTSYNEFIETGLEQGIIAAILLGVLFITAIAYGWKNLSAVELGIKASVIAIAVLLVCSYPLKVLPISLYLVFCLSVVFHKRGKQLFPKNRFAGQCLSAALIMLTGVITYQGLSNTLGLYLLLKGQERVINDPLTAINIYHRAEKHLTNDGIFYFYYGSAYFLAEKYPQAVEALSTSCRLCSNPNSFILLGNACKASGDFQNAEKAYKTAVYMQPLRLYPKYLLAKLYDEAGDTAKAHRWAGEILKTTEKVPTTAAKEIKDEIRLLLQSSTNK